MSEIIIDGTSEEGFRRSIEDSLRCGDAEGAAKRLRELVAPWCGDGKVLPRRFLSVTADDISLSGWGDLQESIARYDRPDHEISAFHMALSEPERGQAQPDEVGLLAPRIETSYFSDEAFPFSEADRADLLDGYSSYGCQWAGDSEGVDHVLSVEGVDDLYGALVKLENRLLGSDDPPEDDIRAGTLGSCYLAVLIHLAVRETIRRKGLPRPMCVLAGNNGIFPFFDAPVMSAEEYLAKGEITPITIAMAPAALDELDVARTPDRTGYEAYEEGSLLNIGIRRTAKKPVLVLDPAELLGNLDQMANAQIGLGPMPEMPPVPAPDFLEPSEGEEVEWFGPVGQEPPATQPDPEPGFSQSEFAGQNWHEIAPADQSQADPAPFDELVSARDVAPEWSFAPAQDIAEPVSVESDAPRAQKKVPQGYQPSPDLPESWYHAHANHASDPHASQWYQEVILMAPAPKPEIAPGQVPETRGHSLRSRLVVVEEPAEEIRPSLLARLGAWLNGLFR